ncbi:MAG: type II toxin-antitoxin system HicB family antitoxin [Anaerovibrio sp.]|uniref:type II toxin-antitoxin system HicB family antitoxin n=1 Tax=Anaerovibrio sp. TaxID=1872532 RepID=UPI002628F49F|nr:type II toxin-antitoxin system HicB family antitoxin [Anaerovibrio sp.]MDD7678736.1 type II toxin-antitoxin system HicB family antitoxin [Anaerovibrio sp.]MDY2603950.1 type II toxin-antitoxin system HicB family antitoxin [Anaerovibrio sp.]
MKKLLYPACFYPCEEQEGYTVVVPDLPGCVTQGRSLLDAIGMAVDAASGWILDEMEDGNPIPPASKIEDVCADDRPGGFVNLIVLDIDAYAEKYGEKAVRKNLTIPAWLNTYAEANNVNFSRVLQDALVAMYQRQTNTSDQYTNERVLL